MNLDLTVLLCTGFKMWNLGKKNRQKGKTKRVGNEKKLAKQMKEKYKEWREVGSKEGSTE